MRFLLLQITHRFERETDGLSGVVLGKAEACKLSGVIERHRLISLVNEKHQEIVVEKFERGREVR